MSIYRRDEINPEWEPSPWPMDTQTANKQELGFHQRAHKPICWQPVPWNAFPERGVCGCTKEWLASVDVAFHATHDAEDLLLIDNVWFGWPDPPRWGLASRPSNQAKAAWTHWGHFPDIPVAWIVPDAAH